MKFRIPLFELNYGEEEEKAVLETIRSKWISMGPKTIDLENRFSEELNVKYSLGVSNCTAALHLACMAVGLKPGDEVICPSLTFVATANAVMYTGAKPVFCDVVSIDNPTINYEKIREAVNSNTKAIIVMHYGGFPCDMDEILQIAKDFNLKVIEDACHGPLSEYKGRKLGTIGDIGCFSFFSNKNISTGEGGMIVTNDEEIYNKLKTMRSHGMTTMSYQRAQGHATQYDVIDLGYNYRIDDIHSALAIAQLKKLRKDLEKRAYVRENYIEKLSGVKEIIIPFSDFKGFTSNYIFPTVLKNGDKKKREKVRKFLYDNGVQTSVHYPPVHRFSIYNEWNSALPVTEYISDNEITLPMYASLTIEQIDYISDLLKKALK
jgi:dTDP-4-amino-4,6-dideoxygalactose transaminase